MKWYVPSWNGDIRFESTGDNTVVTIIAPTKAEIAKLVVMERVFFANGWLKGPLWDPAGDAAAQVRIIEASLLDVGKRIVDGYTQGAAVLTAIRFEDGGVTAIEAGEGFWRKIGEALHLAGSTVREAEDIRAAGDETMDTVATSPEPAKPSKSKKKPEAEVAATVRKPTSCCPDCVIAPIEPAREVLFEFLTQAERDEWNNDHAIVVTGGLTGHRYLLAHRSSRWAAKHTKICHDLDDDVTLHFHDTSIPPEEEVLAAKLILEHREPWLRHEATFFGRTDILFENPFGDWSDGTRSAGLTSGFGDLMLEMGVALTRQRN